MNIEWSSSVVNFYTAYPNLMREYYSPEMKSSFHFYLLFVDLQLFVPTKEHNSNTIVSCYIYASLSTSYSVFINMQLVSDPCIAVRSIGLNRSTKL